MLKTALFKNKSQARAVGASACLYKSRRVKKVVDCCPVGR